MVSTPNIAILGRIPGSTRYSNMARHPNNEQIQGLFLFRVESPILYFNVNNIQKAVQDSIANQTYPIKVVIMDLSTSAYIDSSGAQFIKKLYIELKVRGISFRVAEAHSEVRDILRYEEIEHLFGHVSHRDSIHDMVNVAVEEHMLIIETKN